MIERDNQPFMYWHDDERIEVSDGIRLVAAFTKPKLLEAHSLLSTLTAKYEAQVKHQRTMAYYDALLKVIERSDEITSPPPPPAESEDA